MILVDNRNVTDPYVNLAIEEYLVQHADCTRKDYLLLYINNPSIIIGRNQSIYREVNFEYLRNGTLAPARRITGGGTVYHDEGNLSFVFISAFADDKVNNYRHFNGPVINALVKAGLPAIADDKNNIICGGKKISGSAQFTNRKNIISHGTLLFNANLPVLRECLHPNPFKVTSKAVASNPAPVTNIAQISNAFASINELKNWLVQQLGITGTQSFTNEQWHQINLSAQAKFRSFQWTYGRSPKTVINKPGIEIAVTDGLVTDVTAHILPAAVIQSLIGQPYQYHTIKKALENANALQYLNIIF